MDNSPARVPLDLVLVGGGLANCVTALAVLHQRPDARIALIERGSALAGNHTWCLHPQDMPTQASAWLEPILSHRWSGYDVYFGDHSRTLTGTYAALTSADLARAVRTAFERSPGSHILLDSTADRIDAHEVRLSDGRTLRGRAVLDARGPGRADPGQAGFQKFVGLELDLTRSHGLERPILMDARVAQQDGFAFMYVLPFGPTRLLVEDTTFSRSPHLDQAEAEARVRGYAERFGQSAIARREAGVLPMPFRPARVSAAGGALRLGYGAGLFHPATGYSFPVALRVACHVAKRVQDGEPESIANAAFAELLRRHESQARFARHLNWLLFHGFENAAMWHVFARFYRLPEPLIHRFYAMNLSRLDRMRILLGRPPEGISISAALRRARSERPRARRTSAAPPSAGPLAAADSPSPGPERPLSAAHSLAGGESPSLMPASAAPEGP